MNAAEFKKQFKCAKSILNREYICILSLRKQ